MDEELKLAREELVKCEKSNASWRDSPRRFHYCGEKKTIRSYSAFVCSCCGENSSIDFDPAKKIKALETKSAQRLTILKENEWIDVKDADYECGWITFCPECNKEKLDGHATDCKLARAIEEEK